MTLAEFLDARLAEDDSEAWDVHEGGCATAGPVTFPCDCGYPARVLREVQAKRKILVLHSPDTWNADDDPEAIHCIECTTDDDLYKPQMWPCATLRALAGVHGGHPDYDPAWR